MVSYSYYISLPHIHLVESANAKKLIELEVNGRKAEVVKASNDDQEALTKAFNGAEGIYATSLYNVDMKKKFDPENKEELECGRAMIEAAKSTSTTLKYFLFQTMHRFKTHPTDLGLPVPVHYMTKYALEEEIKNTELPWIFLRQAGYMRQVRFLLKGSNQISSFHPFENKVGFVEEEDIGKLVASILAPKDESIITVGQTINAITVLATPPELAKRSAVVIPGFSPDFKQTSPTYSKYLFKALACFVGGPIFPYVGAISENFGFGNALDMDESDLEKCQSMTAEFGGLTTYEEWLEKYMTEEPHGDKRDVSMQTKFQETNRSQNGSKSSPLLAQIKQLLTY